MDVVNVSLAPGMTTTLATTVRFDTVPSVSVTVAVTVTVTVPTLIVVKSMYETPEALVFTVAAATEVSLSVAARLDTIPLEFAPLA